MWLWNVGGSNVNKVFHTDEEDEQTKLAKIKAKRIITLQIKRFLEYYSDALYITAEGVITSLNNDPPKHTHSQLNLDLI